MRLSSSGEASVTQGDDDAQAPLNVTAVERLLRAVQELSFSQTLEEVQQIVRAAAREITGCDGATFVLNDEGLYCRYVDEDAIEPLWKGLRFSQDICISGWVMRHRQSVVIPDIYADPRIPKDAYRPTFVKSLAMVPIRTMQPVGAIGNYWATPHVATALEVQMLQSLADSTSVAMENIRIRSEMEQRVTDRTLALQQANSEIWKTASTDKLTGFLNRHGFDESMHAAEMAGILKNGVRLQIAFLDVDGLKKVNDGLGHAQGDALLCDVAHAMRRSFRASDVMARFGGDEFCVAIISPGLEPVALEARLEDQVALMNAELKRPYHISVSMGVVETVVDGNIPLTRMLAEADRLMYERKARRKAGH